MIFRGYLGLMVEAMDRIRQICLRPVAVATVKLGVAEYLNDKCIFFQELTESEKSCFLEFTLYSRIIGDWQVPGASPLLQPNSSRWF